MDPERRPASGQQSETADDWRRAVVGAIDVMRENLGEDHTLRTLARTAWLSPFHFHRVFARVTDSTPARFLAAWRMAEAKRMLAFGSASVTEICMEIGYASLGTFTSQFTRMVGVPPGRFRRLVVRLADHPLDELLAEPSETPAAARPQVTVVVGDDESCGLAAVGLFASPIPQQRPAACAVARVPATVTFGALPDGLYYPLAACFDPAVDVVEAVGSGDPQGCLVGTTPQPVHIVDGVAVSEPVVSLSLRPRTATDPPIVLAPMVVLAADAARVSVA